MWRVEKRGTPCWLVKKEEIVPNMAKVGLRMLALALKVNCTYWLACW